MHHAIEPAETVVSDLAFGLIEPPVCHQAGIRHPEAGEAAKVQIVDQAVAVRRRADIERQIVLPPEQGQTGEIHEVHDPIVIEIGQEPYAQQERSDGLGHQTGPFDVRMDPIREQAAAVLQGRVKVDHRRVLLA